MTARTLPLDAGFAQEATPAAARPLVDRIPPIPSREKMHGRLTARRLWRFYAMLGLLFLIGIAPIALQMSVQWKAFGLGLLLPGGGFLYAGGIVGILGAVLSAAAFAVFFSVPERKRVFWMM